MSFGRKCFILSNFGRRLVENTSFWAVLVGYSLECETSFRPPLQANALKRSEIVAGREGSWSEGEWKCWMFCNCYQEKQNRGCCYNSWTIIHFTSVRLFCSRNARSIKQPLFPTFHSMTVLFQLNCLWYFNKHSSHWPVSFQVLTIGRH